MDANIRLHYTCAVNFVHTRYSNDCGHKTSTVSEWNYRQGEPRYYITMAGNTSIQNGILCSKTAAR